MTTSVDALTEASAKARLAELADLLAQADIAYHQEDAPRLTDAEYDALKAENRAIEARFPALKRTDSPSDRIGAAPAEAFARARRGARVPG